MSAAQETYEPALPEVTQSKTAYISYGLPFEQACLKHIKETFHAQRVYVIASGGLTKSSDALTRLKDALGPRLAAVHIGIPQHTPFTSILDISKEVRDKQADCILTLGGGSLSDAAKLITLVVANPQHADIFSLYDPSIKSLQDISNDSPPGISDPTIPIICVPTSLSAGEYSAFSGCTDSNHVKWQFHHPRINPDLVVLDPSLTLTTPERVWLSTGVRAIDHCTEALSNLTPHPVVDPVAQAALAELAENLLLSKNHPKDTQARLKLQLGARRAMLSLNLRVPIGASHGIGHMLGPLGVGHGVTSCVLLPAVLAWNYPVNSGRQGLVRDALWSKPSVAQLFERRGLQREGSKASELMRVLFDELGMPSSLKDVGVGRERFGELASASMKDPCIPTNPRRIEGEEQILEILDMAAGDQ